MKKKVTCKIIMPISATSEYSEKHWSDVKSIVIEACSLSSTYNISCDLVSNDDSKDIIHSKIISNLIESDLIICDTSVNNPNVMFELGLRLAFKKPTIIIKDQDTKPPFDTGIIEYVKYPNNLAYYEINRFKESLSKKVDKLLDSFYEGKYLSFLETLTISVPEISSSVIKKEEVPYYEMIMNEMHKISRDVSRNSDYLRRNNDSSHNVFNRQRTSMVRAYLTSYLSKYKDTPIDPNELKKEISKLLPEVKSMSLSEFAEMILSISRNLEKEIVFSLSGSDNGGE